MRIKYIDLLVDREVKLRELKRSIKAHSEKIAQLTRIVIVLLFLILAILALHLSFAYEADHWVITNSEFGRFLAHTLINIAPELAGIVIGVVTIDYLNERRQGEQLKKQLILQMSSKHNDVTDTAVRILRANGWLSDGTLEDSFIVDANLQGSDLSSTNLGRVIFVNSNLEAVGLKKANLSGAYVINTNLRKAYFKEANLKWFHAIKSILEEAVLEGVDLSYSWLSETNLTRANLENAKLNHADLDGSSLEKANLKMIEMQGCNLRGASFKEANLEGANLNNAENWTREQLLQAESLANATMPDGKKYEQWQTVNE